jgi:hypothetical protein
MGAYDRIILFVDFQYLYLPRFGDILRFLILSRELVDKFGGLHAQPAGLALLSHQGVDRVAVHLQILDEVVDCGVDQRHEG